MRTLKGERNELYWSKREQEEGGGVKGRERGGGRGGGVEAGVLDSENNGRICWQPSMIGRLS